MNHEHNHQHSTDEHNSDQCENVKYGIIKIELSHNLR